MTPLLWSTLTILVYFASRHFFLRTKQPLLHPILWGTVILITVLDFTGQSYSVYEQDTEWLVWLLGPAVVALAVPIYKLRRLVFAHARLLAVVLLASVFFSVFSVDLLLSAFPLDRAVVKALTLKSVTAPVAFEIARESGGTPELSAIGVMIAGIMGAVLGPWVLRITGVTDPKAVGLALGCTSHGIGTARALDLGEAEGAFASIGMSCSAIMASIVCPLLLRSL